MQAIGVSQYGPPSRFETRQIPAPGPPTGRDLLIQYASYPDLSSFFLTFSLE